MKSEEYRVDPPLEEKIENGRRQHDVPGEHELSEIVHEQGGPPLAPCPYLQVRSGSANRSAGFGHVYRLQRRLPCRVLPGAATARSVSLLSRSSIIFSMRSSRSTATGSIDPDTLAGGRRVPGIGGGPLSSAAGATSMPESSATGSSG